MISAKSFFLKCTPCWFQDLAVSIYNWKLYRQRHSGAYHKWRDYYRSWEVASKEDVQLEISKRLSGFLEYASHNSAWYEKYQGKSLREFPVLDKIQILNSLSDIATITEEDALVSLTGGTTGSSMKVYYTPSDMQERFAILDLFRESYGYRLGEKVAWFSGKDLATSKDVEKGRCYRDDLVNKIRFFSTFHISKKNFDHYWAALEKFKPRYMIGFPSSIYDIAVMAHERGLKASYDVQTVFPTAETVLPMHRKVIGYVFNTRLVDQYASSEGAPFILECTHGRLHIHPLSGVFEVVDSDGSPALEGEMLVTSFTTHGTPLIRYRIGDRIKLADPGETCSCGSDFPLVDWIDGRSSDFVWSPENGRVNLGNLSNSTKDVEGIHCFQIVQDEINEIFVRVVGRVEFDAEQERAFLAALRLRTGSEMKIDLQRVGEIPREKSGKFRVVKNSIADRVLE